MAKIRRRTPYLLSKVGAYALGRLLSRADAEAPADYLTGQLGLTLEEEFRLVDLGLLEIDQETGARRVTEFGRNVHRAEQDAGLFVRQQRKRRGPRGRR